MLTSKKIIDEAGGIGASDGDEPADLEEIIFRSHFGVHVDKEVPLERKTKNKDLLVRLLRIEREAIRRAREKGIIRGAKRNSSGE